MIRDKNSVRAMNVTGGSLEFGHSYKNLFDGISGMVIPTTISLSPGGNCLFTSNEGNSSLSAFKRSADNSLSFAGTTSLANWGYNTRSWDTAVSSDGEFLYVNLINDSNYSFGIYAVDPATCALAVAGHAGASNRDSTFALAPDGSSLYTIDPIAGGTETLRVYDRNPADGSLTEVQSLAGGPAGTPGIDGGSGLAVSPDGANVYVTSSVEMSVTTLTRAGDGRLSFRSKLTDDQNGADGLDQPGSVVISPDGRNVYVGSGGDRSLAAFARGAGGDLSFLQKLTEADAPKPPQPSPPTYTPPPPAWTPPPPGQPGCQPNSGSVGATINKASLYTNEPRVRLAITAPAGASSVRISNDGGFAGADSRPLEADGMYGWKLRSSGPERLPRTVYVRFVGSCLDPSQTYSDDIILDETAPVVSAASATAAVDAAPVRASTGITPVSSSVASADEPVRATAGVLAAGSGRFLLSVKARDNASGVSALQLATSRTRPSNWRKFTPRVRATKRPAWVRVRDRAGNNSRWFTVALRRR